MYRPLVHGAPGDSDADSGVDTSALHQSSHSPFAVEPPCGCFEPAETKVFVMSFNPLHVRTYIHMEYDGVRTYVHAYNTYIHIVYDGERTYVHMYMLICTYILYMMVYIHAYMYMYICTYVRVYCAVLCNSV